MKRYGPSCRRLGVTLIEIVLAMGLLVTLSSMVYWFYGASLRTRDDDLREANRLQLARVVLDRMATELRQVAASSGHRAVGLRGEAERIWFCTVRVPAREPYNRRLLADDETPLGEFDLAKIEYKIARHPDIEHDDGYLLPLGLARVEIKVPRKDSAESGEAFEEVGEGFEDGTTYGGEEKEDLEDADFEDGLEDPEAPDEPDPAEDIHWEELYAPEIRYLRFCYFDGHKWWDDWEITGENPLPQLILVTIGFEPHPPFGDEFNMEEEDEEFCSCLNEQDVDVMECAPLPEDQFSIVVRMTGADVFFGSRISRESKAVVDEMGL